MFKFLLSLKGNARICLFTEPLWGVPFNLFAPFVTLYMYHLGVLDIEIGIILAVSRIVQMGTALLAGVITDKFGRRLTTFVADCIAWSIPALIWAFSQNFWWFLVAAVINGSLQITMVSWECLWVDDTEEKHVSPIFNWIYISGLLAVFFAPIAGYFVYIHGVVPVVRIIYILTFLSMTVKFVILYFLSTETERGKERMAATKGVPITQLLAGYKNIFVQIIRSGSMVQALALQALLSVVILITGTFFALYATQNLLMPDAFLAGFPILRAGVMLAFLLVIQDLLNKFNPKKVMLFGLVLYVASMAWLLTAPVSNWAWLGVYVFIEACATALLLPRIDSIAAKAIDPEERARIRSLFNMVIMAISAPLAFLAGLLSDMDRQFPFILNIFLFAIMAVVVLKGARKQRA
ncbi:MAG: MFS transporter [Defluviitaleaceae bacterium]|nr:MFS transporter [Defluviitaleaceae bacterium]